MESLARYIDNKLNPLGFSLSEMIVVNMVFIAIADSYVVYGEWNIFKVLVYGVKFINALSCLLLIQRNTISNYKFLLSLIPFLWFFTDISNIGNTLKLYYSGFFPLAVFALISDADRIRIAALFIKILFFLCIIGIPIYILVNVVGISPLFSIQRGEFGFGRLYNNYLLFYFTRHGVELRFSSIFDEPGVLGTIISLILFYYKDRLSRLQFIIFFISGLLTFSLFFILVAIPILYFSALRKLTTRIRLFRVISFIVIMAVSYIGFVAFARSTQNNRALALKIYYRFEWEGDWIVGIVNNRDQTIKGFESFYHSYAQLDNGQFYYGMGHDYMVKSFGGGTLSYRVLILEKGIIACIYLFIVLASWHDWKRNFLFSSISMVLLFLTFFQRPGIYIINYILLIYCGLRYYTYGQDRAPKLL